MLVLEVPPGFRPDQLKEVSLEEGEKRVFRLVNASGGSTRLQANAHVEPVNEHGKLVIRVMFPESGPTNEGELTGQVVNDQGRPIAGAGSDSSSTGSKAAASTGARDFLGGQPTRRAIFTSGLSRVAPLMDHQSG